MKESLPFSAVKAGVFCALLLAAAASNAAATRLRLDRAVLDFDPNQPIWHVSTHLCNVDQAPSGNLNYHLWLYNDDPSARGGKSHFFNLGGIRFKNILKPGECWDYNDSAVRIGYTKLTPGQYHIQLTVGEWNGTKFVPVISQPFVLENGMYQDFIKQ